MKLTICLDWLSLTFKELNREAQAFLDTYASYSTIQAIPARNGYTFAQTDSNGSELLWNPNYEEMGTHAVFSGTALRNLQQLHGIQLETLLQEAIHTGANITRLDIAKDLTGTRFDFETVYQSLKQGNLTGYSRKYRRLESDDGGYTIYIGSRTSESYIRIYDKAAESKLPGELWARFEVETKGQKARAIARLLLESKSWSSVFDAYVQGQCGSLALLGLDAFISPGNVPVGLPKITRVTDRERWIETQVTSAIAKHFIEHPDSEAIRRLRRTLDLIERQMKE